jgi:hypothetical protein
MMLRLAPCGGPPSLCRRPGGPLLRVLMLTFLEICGQRRTFCMFCVIRSDGIPLAIELAAARAATLGIQALATPLDDRFHPLIGGGRAALPRHQTLLATLDQSYELLTEPERTVLRRLAVFAGPFSPAAACAVVASSEIPPLEVVDRLSTICASHWSGPFRRRVMHRSALR